MIPRLFAVMFVLGMVAWEVFNVFASLSPRGGQEISAIQLTQVYADGIFWVTVAVAVAIAGHVGSQRADRHTRDLLRSLGEHGGRKGAKRLALLDPRVDALAHGGVAWIGDDRALAERARAKLHAPVEQSDDPTVGEPVGDDLGPRVGLEASMRVPPALEPAGQLRFAKLRAELSAVHRVVGRSRTGSIRGAMPVGQRRTDGRIPALLDLGGARAEPGGGGGLSERGDPIRRDRRGAASGRSQARGRCHRYHLERPRARDGPGPGIGQRFVRGGAGERRPAERDAQSLVREEGLELRAVRETARASVRARGEVPGAAAGGGGPGKGCTNRPLCHISGWLSAPAA